MHTVATALAIFGPALNGVINVNHNDKICFAVCTGEKTSGICRSRAEDDAEVGELTVVETGDFD